MAIALANHAQNKSSTNTVTTAGITTTGGSGTVFFIAATLDPGVTPSSVADNKGNSANYTQRAYASTAASGCGRLVLYLCEGGTGGAGHTFTFTASGNSFSYIFAGEITGAATSSAFDISVTGTDTSSPWTILSGTLAQSAEMILALIGGDANTSHSSTFNPGTGWTNFENGPDDVNQWTGAIAYKIISSTASDGPSWTVSGGTNATLLLVSVKEAMVVDTLMGQICL